VYAPMECACPFNLPSSNTRCSKPFSQHIKAGRRLQLRVRSVNGKEPGPPSKGETVRADHLLYSSVFKHANSLKKEAEVNRTAHCSSSL